MQPNDRTAEVPVQFADEQLKGLNADELATLIEELDEIIKKDADGTGLFTVAHQRRALRLLRAKLHGFLTERLRLPAPPPIPKGGAE